MAKCTKKLLKNLPNNIRAFGATYTERLTLRARFMVAKRSLYQLLDDKTNDWLNPKMVEKMEKKLSMNLENHF